MNITDMLKEIPLSAVLKERIEFEQSKAEFALDRMKTERDDFKAKFDACSTRLEDEKKEHQLTRQELQKALEEVGFLSGKTKAPTKIRMNLGIGKIPNVF